MLEDIEVSVKLRDGLIRLFSGRARLGDRTLKFEGIVYPSVGGPNVSAHFTDESLKILEEMGYAPFDVEKLQEQLNTAILNGDARMVDELGE
jgi:hypothetical protein